jgi:hypothetical protein
VGEAVGVGDGPAVAVGPVVAVGALVAVASAGPTSAVGVRAHGLGNEQANILTMATIESRMFSVFLFIVTLQAR